MSVRRLGSAAVWLVPVVFLLAVIAGCSATPQPSGARGIVRPRIPENLLQDNGLQTIWYYPSDGKDNPVSLVELAPEGLMVATVPTDVRGRLTFLSRTSGAAAWSFPLAYSLQHPPTVYRYPAGVTGRDDEVLFTQLDKLYCVDLQHGSELWSADLPHSVSTRVGADEMDFFFGSDNGRIYGFRKKTAVEQWQYRTGGTIHAPPVVQGEDVYLASTDGYLYHLVGVQPGWIPGTSWRFQTGARILGAPVTFSRWVLVGSSDYNLYCLEAKDGTEHWKFPAEAPIEDAPVVYSVRPNQEYAFCVTVRRIGASEERTLFCVRLRDGREVWRKTGIRRVVTLGKTNLYVLTSAPRGQEPSILALNVDTGEELFRLPVTGFPFIPHNSADSGRDASERGRIYLVARDWTIHVIGEKE